MGNIWPLCHDGGMEDDYAHISFLGILNCLFLHLYESAMSRAVGIGVWKEDKAQEGQQVCSLLMNVTKSE
jgi:hypothetical protein